MSASNTLNDEAVLLKAVMDTVLDGVITIDSRGTIRSINPAAVRIFGYPPQEVIGKNISMLMPEPYRANHDNYLKNYLNTGIPKVIGIGREVMGQRKDRSIFPLDLGVNAMDLDGEHMFVGTIRDITLRKKAEAEIEQMVGKLIEANTELERFAYVASHDMQEPLRMIANFSQIINDEYKEHLDDTGQQYLHIITESVRRMQRMVEDLLTYARVNKEVQKFVDFDVNTEIEHVVHNLADAIQTRKAQISSKGFEFIKASGNPVQFMRVIQNLISNALKYQPPHQEPQIELLVEDLGDMWQFAVKDNGIGIDTSYFKQIFEPFRRLHSQQEYTGTGLGLTACKKIIENHRGTIWLSSESGKGSCFYFTWPKAHHEEFQK